MALEMLDPRERAPILESRDRPLEEHEPAGHHQVHGGQRQPLGAAFQRSRHDVVSGLRIGAHVERRLPGRAVVPRQRFEVVLGGRRAEPCAPGGADHRQHAVEEIQGHEVAVTEAAVARMRVEPEAIRIARAAEERQEPAVDRVRQRADLRPPEAEPLGQREASALLRVAAEHLEDEVALCGGGTGVDDVQQLASRRPVDQGLAARGLERVAQRAEMLLPRQRASAGPEDPRRRKARRAVVLLEPIGLARGCLVDVLDGQPVLVVAEEIRQAVAAIHGRRSEASIEFYSTESTATSERGVTSARRPRARRLIQTHTSPAATSRAMTRRCSASPNARRSRSIWSPSP